MPSPIMSPGSVVEGMKEAKIENGDSDEDSTLDAIVVESSVKREEDHLSPSLATDAKHTAATTFLANQRHGSSPSQSPKSEDEELVGGDITVKLEPGHPPKLARASIQKVPARAAPLFDHLPDATPDAIGTFQVITDCSYTPKYLGDTEHAMECDCAEEWGMSYSTISFSSLSSVTCRSKHEHEPGLW